MVADLYIIFLYIHIITGFMALTSGAIALIVRKGNKLHLLSGRSYTLLMLVVAGSALVLSLLKPNTYLLLIALFATYQTITGYRAVKRKVQQPHLFDWLVTLVGATTGVVMIASLNLVLIVFGCISLFLAILDLRYYIALLQQKDLPKLIWLTRHIGFMTGAYIATFTAFVVVNIHFKPVPWLPWLAPTIIGVPLMQYWTIKYTKKPVSQKTKGGESSHTDHTENAQ